MQINETNSYTEYTTTESTTDFVVGFEYFNNKSIDTVNITVDGIDAVTAGYVVTKVNDSVFRLTPEVPSGTTVRLVRETDLDAPIYKFSEGALFRAPNVDANFKQILHAQQEVRDNFSKLKNDIGFTNLEQTIIQVQAAYQDTLEAQNAAENSATAAGVTLAAVEVQANLTQDYANAANAAKDIAQQSASDATTQVGTLKTYVDSAVGAISTDASKQYATLALANADIANIALNKNIFVSEAANGGYWYKDTAGATSLTKSPYDPLTQAKDADLQPLATKEGIFFVRPYYEMDFVNKKLYMKLGSTTGNDTFYIRDSRYAAAMKLKSDVINGVNSSSHPKLTTGQTSPLGVADCLCFDTKVALYYDVRLGTFIASDRTQSGATNPNQVKVVEIDEGEIVECTEKSAILTQIYMRNDALISNKIVTSLSYADTAFTKDGRANRNRGININTETSKIEIPNGFSVLYATSKSRFKEQVAYYTTSNLELDLVDTVGTWLIFDHNTNSLTTVQRTNIDTYPNPFQTVAVIRHSADKKTIHNVNFDGCWSINDSLFGQETYMNKMGVILPLLSSGTKTFMRFYPNISTVDSTLTFFADTILTFGNRHKSIPSDFSIDLSVITSSTKRIYYDVKKDIFIVKAYNTTFTQYERTALYFLCEIRLNFDDYFANATCDIGIEYTVNGLLYNIPKPVDAAKNSIVGLTGIAHRGYSTTAPENTKAAYKLAKANSFKAAETDIQKTSDGVFICHHDTLLTKVTQGLYTDRVSDHTWDELKDLDIGSWKSPEYSSERFLTLKDFCELCYRLNLYAVIELSPALTFSLSDMRQIIKIVKDSGVGHVYISFIYTSLWNTIKADNAANVQYLSETIDTNAINAVKNLRTPFNDPQLSVNHTAITSKSVVDSLKTEHCIRLNCWTVNDEARALQLADFGVATVSSDFIVVENIVE